MLRQFASTPAKAARLAVRLSRASASALTSTSAFVRAAPTASPIVCRATAVTAGARPRWYSSAADAKTDEPAADAKDGEAAAGEALSAADAAALRKELETKAKETLDWKDKYLRSVADFRNLQERTAREMKSARDYAITQFAKDLVDSVDNLDRALTMVPEKSAEEADTAALAEAAIKDLDNLVDGIRMTETVLLQTLKKHGLERFDPAGDKFNPNEHEATFMTPMADKEHNTVFHTQQKGFRLNGRVLRAAKVGVVNNSGK